MRFPQVSDRVKEAPAQALRGVFAGIGQLLLFTDKLRNKTPASQQVPRARVPQPSETAPDAAAPLRMPLRRSRMPLRRSRMPLRRSRIPLPPLPDAAPPLPDTAPPAGYAAPPEPEPDRSRRGHALAGREGHGGQGLRQDRQRTAADQRRSRSSRAGASHGCGRDGQRSGHRRHGRRDARPGAAGAPLPNYDELSIASLRARLRSLDVTQLRQLVEYEKAHAARGDVLAMFERRIAKLEAGA